MPRPIREAAARGFALALAAIAFAGPGDVSRAQDRKPPLSAAEVTRLVLHDPASPTAGDPSGDVTIVEFSDYNCPYCRRSTRQLDAFLATDPHVRVIYKDWPILASSSVLEAKVAIAAGYQGHYHAAHDALMAIVARPATKDQVKAAMEVAGLDVARLNGDLAAHDGDITALLRRNNEEAEALGFNGTPVFLVGPFVFAQEMDEAGFRQAVADARAKRVTKTGDR